MHPAHNSVEVYVVNYPPFALKMAIIYSIMRMQYAQIPIINYKPA
jgi:hypothetical protein